MTPSPEMRGEAAAMVLLVVRDPRARTQLRRALDTEHSAVVAVGSIAEALVRVRGRFYDVVVCAELDRDARLEDHFAMFIDSRAVLFGGHGRDSLYAAAGGLRTRGVLLCHSVDTDRVRRALAAAMASFAGSLLRS